MKLSKAELYLKTVFDQEGDLKEITRGVKDIQKYRKKSYSYNSKNIRVKSWQIDQTEIRELIICIFAAVVAEPCLTYQALIGKLNHKIDLLDKIDRVKTLAEVIAVVSKTGLWGIAQTAKDGYYYVSTDYQLNCLLPEENKHQIQFSRPQPIESNKDRTYGRMMLGNPQHFHQGELCLGHLDKVNQTKLVLNQEFIQTFKEEPKKPLDTEMKKIQWAHFIDKSNKAYKLLGTQKFHMIHKYCSRGRTYACGYYVTPQGAAYKKASVELYNKEILR